MAAEYEVNIKLNTQQVERQLKSIDTRTKRTGRMATENINALVKAQDKRARLMNKINELEAKGLNVAKLRKQMGQATTELAKRRFGSLQQEFRVLERNVRLEESKLRIMRSQAVAARDRAKFLAGADVGRGQFGPAAPAFQGPRQMIASPIGGAANIPGSPAFLRRQRRNKTLEQVGLGAGFPLLFGGGPGAVLGGAAGGLTGSFGAQIAFSAIGQQIDRFIASVAAVGTALTSASGTLEMFREKNLFSSDAVKQHAFELEEQGRMQELATLLTKDLASQIGKNAVESFQLLGGETKEFLKTINHLFLAVQGFVAGPLAKLLSAINTVLGGVSTDLQFGSLRGSLTGDAAAQFEAIVAEARGTKALTGPERQRALRQGAPLTKQGRLTTAVKETVLKDPRVAKLRQTIDVAGQTTLDDTLGFKPPKDEAKAKAERQQLEAFLALNKQITAELDRQDEINAMNGKHIAEQLNNADKINNTQEKRAGLLQAQINGTEDEFRLNQAIKEIKDKGLLPADENRLIAAEKQIHAMEEQAQQIKKQKQLYEQVGSAIKDGIVDGIMSAIEGTKSLSESLSGVLRQLASMFMQAGVSSLGQSLKIPGFANGGNPPVGRPSIVGERGPELFVPRTAGTIIPNHAMGGANIVVNVDASGTQAQGDQPNAKALGSAIGAAVQAELIKQKRPGGLLS